MTDSVSAALLTISAELSTTSRAMAAEDRPSFQGALTRIAAADRVFILGAGRSGLALSMVGMRLMHLGLDVHIVGDATTPAIERGDLLLVASGSGSTAGIVRNAKAAKLIGASIVAITTDPDSPLALLSSVAIVIPAAQKRDHSAEVSAQYAGSLFEQSVLVLGDSLFHASWLASGRSAEQLWPRHANLE
jgi:6-phospho-3-hexuloisomerase